MKNKYQLPGITTISSSKLVTIVILLLLLCGILPAQDLVVQDTTIVGNETFAALNSVTAGPNFVVAASGQASLIAPRVSIIPYFSVAAGGQLYIVSRSVNSVDLPQEIIVPKSFTVNQNFPNPFNPSTRVVYELPRSAQVQIAIYDVNGRQVRQLVEKHQSAGRYSVVWNGTGQSGEKLSSGIYFLHLIAGKEQSQIKMTLLK